MYLFNLYRPRMKKIINLLSNSPFYPHWLEFKTLNILIDAMISMLHGDILEVGSGQGLLKNRALSTNLNITSYTATDFSSWNSTFEEYGNAARSNNILDALRLTETRILPDKYCDAMDLPFDNESFDCHISVETFEHIPNSNQYFKEAARILKPGGLMMFTAPFLYRAHPDFESDFVRLLPGAYKSLASENGLIMENFQFNTGIGGTCAALINQYLIRLFLEKSILVKLLIIMVMPFVFFSSNICGYLIDKNLDPRFATRFLLVFRKNF